MARINVEDEIYSDKRFINLIGLVGDIDRAVGMLVRTWRVGQKWYLNQETNRMIPRVEWDKQEISDLVIKSGLVEVVDDKIRICGADEHFKWLLKCQTAGKNNRKGYPMVPQGTLSNLEAPRALTLTPTLPLKTKTMNKSKTRDRTITQTLGTLDEFKNSETLASHLQGVSQELQKLWLETYPDPAWVRQTLLEAIAYKIRKGKTYRDLSRYFSGWLSRAENKPRTPPAPPLTGDVGYYQELTPEQERVRREASIQKKIEVARAHSGK